MNNSQYAACRSFLVSQGLQLWATTVAAVGIGYSLGPANGGFNDFASFEGYMSHAWFGIVLAAVFGLGPFYRAKQGSDAATGIVRGPTSTSIPNGQVNPDSVIAVKGTP